MSNLKETKRPIKKRTIISLSAGLIAAAILLSVFLLNSPGSEDRPEEIRTSEDLYAYNTPAENIENSSGLKYVNNELLMNAKEGIKRDIIEQEISKFNGEIVGYNKYLSMYQIMFAEIYTYDELKNMSIEILNTNLFSDVFVNYVFDVETEDLFENEDITDDKVWLGEWGSRPGGGNWGVEAINAPQMWNADYPLSNVNVGVFDNQFFTNHEDLNFVKTSFNVKKPTNYHGTHVTGTIAAKNNNGIGIAGIATNADIYGFSYVSTIQGEFFPFGNYLFALTQLIAVDECRVVNISLAFDHEKNFAASRGNQPAIDLLNRRSEIMEKQLQRLLDSGYEFVLVLAAGNANSMIAPSIRWRYEYDPDSIYSFKYNEEGKEYGNVFAEYEMLANIKDGPIRDRIIVVGAAELAAPPLKYFLDIKYYESMKDIIAEKYFVSDFSNRGPRVDLIAPGRNIESTIFTKKLNSSYDKLTGTSMAAPHVTGVASMVWGINPNLTGADVKNIICSSASGSYKYQDSAFNDRYKMLDGYAACQMAKAGTYVGGTVRFGNYEWRVLDIKNGKALLITKDVVLFNSYDDSDKPYSEGASWGSCTLRKYLNNEFYNEFSEDEKARILETTNTYKSDLYGKTSAAKDRIFILDMKEAKQYFKNDADRMSKLNVSEKDIKKEAEMRYKLDKKYGRSNTSEHYYNLLSKDNGKDASWDLRSMYAWGDLPHMSCVGINGYVYEDFSDDLIYDGDGGITGGDNTFPRGQRPVMWVTLID